MAIAIDVAREIESEYFGVGCQWPPDQLRQSAQTWSAAAQRLLAGESIDIGEDMGSCQCGPISASVFMRNGVLWAVSHGRVSWQQYDGPADKCDVPYRVGVRARQHAMAIVADSAG